MQKAVFLAAVLFFSVGGFAQAGGGSPPPGGDMVGSDHTVTPRGGVRQQPNQSPNQNQEMTNTGGTTTGYERSPAKAGSSIHGSAQAQQNIGTEGLQGKSSATAGRRRARNRKQSAEDSGAQSQQSSAARTSTSAGHQHSHKKRKSTPKTQPK